MDGTTELKRHMCSTGRSDVRLVSLKVAGKTLGDDEFQLNEKKLTILSLPEGSFEVEIETDIKPQVLLLSLPLQVFSLLLEILDILDELLLKPVLDSQKSVSTLVCPLDRLSKSQRFSSLLSS